MEMMKMKKLMNVDLIYFSPTGGTLKCANILCKAMALNTRHINLGQQDFLTEPPEADLVVIAAPVFGGRLPRLVADRLRAYKGDEARVVTMVVYGTRAYEDALIELNDIAKSCGFDVVASAAVVAEHSIVREVGAGRPDADDKREITDFAKQVINKIEMLDKGEFCEVAAVEVPGNFPYKDGMKVAATPICMPGCVNCGQCAIVCPTGAISISEGKIYTRLDRCMMCMACIAKCPNNARMLPTPVQAGTEEHLKHLVSVRRENEFYL